MDRAIWADGLVIPGDMGEQELLDKMMLMLNYKARRVKVDLGSD